MNNQTFKGWLAASTSTALLATMMSAGAAYAQDTSADTLIEDEIVTIGTRRTARSAVDTPAPIDVISGIEFTRNASNDVQDLLRTSVPSFNINTQPISDAASIVRPANLRGLSPDQTLVLVNGKRRHRGSVISFLGGGISDGAQGVDISAIPSIALKQVEVLRDGASSQYGSDAIAGVLNFVLKDAPEGGTVEAQYGSTYEGDGDNYRFSGNVGLPLGDQGFVNLSAEYGETDGTVRSVVRGDVLGLIAAGNTDVADFRTINSYTDEVPQYWGQPDVTDDFKFFLNSALAVSDSTEFYLFGNYASRQVEGGFFFRNPTNRGGVYRGPQLNPATNNAVVNNDNGTPNNDADDFFTDSVTGAVVASPIDSVRVGDLDGLGIGGDCPAGIPLSQGGGLIQDPSVFAQVAADPNCFAFTETIPGGFVPRFGGENTDYGIAFGVRGDWALGGGVSYDLSLTHGRNKTDFFIRNTINASLGPNTPRDFDPGGQQQTETVLNADFAYLVPTGFASDLSIAFGAEYREETFDLFQGDAASFALGPLADQGFSSSSNGFGGFASSNSATQDSYALYTELETDVTDALTLQGAVRYEDFSAFGDTFDYKIAALFKVNEGLRFRASHSTAFHAPTAGQANITNVTTQNIAGVLVDQGTIPLASAAGQIAADFVEAQFGERPTLGPEDAVIFTAGTAFDAGPTNWTIDFYHIDVDDRIALGANVNFLDALQNAGATATDVSSAITELSGNGTITRSDFTGLEDLSQFRFFTNSFDTRTKGVDVVGRWPFDLAGGFSELTLAGNYNETDVTSVGTVNPINATRVANLEDQLPNIKGFIQWSHTQDAWRGLLRANYYGSWDDVGNGFDSDAGVIDPAFEKGSEILIDAELGYEVAEGIELIVGANNLFDNYPDENPDAADLGQLYPEAAPTGFNGGMYYTKLRINF
ncbi:MAG: TonB-dependent receptor [Litorimonas sp.]